MGDVSTKHGPSPNLKFMGTVSLVPLSIRPWTDGRRKTDVWMEGRVEVRRRGRTRGLVGADVGTDGEEMDGQNSNVEVVERMDRRTD